MTTKILTHLSFLFPSTKTTEEPHLPDHSHISYPQESIEALTKQLEVSLRSLATIDQDLQSLRDRLDTWGSET